MPEFPTRNNNLFRYLRDNPTGDSFPDHRPDYFQRFLSVDEFLNVEVHPNVNTGAAANDEHNARFLTDHGPEHIATVMRRISDLLPDISKLTPYEAYILLTAAHLHDTGNVFGRKGHERRIQIAMKSLGARLGNDGLEQRMIRDIATSHGGYVGVDESNKDTIGFLTYADVDRKIRPKLLAALLRFADELADDYTRTNSFLLDNTAVTAQSEVYHQYADRLREVHVEPLRHLVSLRFEIGRSLLSRTMKKGIKTASGEWQVADVYLFDEIKERCLKMHCEQVYCSRFMQQLVDISQIAVKIQVCGPLADDPQSNEYSSEIGCYKFVLKQAGYPGHLKSLGEVSPEFDRLTGESVMEQFKQVAQTENAENRKVAKS